MIRPINVNNNINKIQSLNVSKQQAGFQSEQQTELAGYEVGRAMKAQRGVIFKSLPNNVTSRYNVVKDDEGHLNLPNIYVYEFPDTNLKVVVNKGKDLDRSLVGLEIKNPNVAKSNSFLPFITYLMLFSAKELQNTDFDCNADGFSYIQQLKSEEDFDLGKLNKNIFMPNFSEQDFTKIKEDLEELFEENDRKDLLEELYNTTLEDVQRYYNDFMKGCSVKANAVLADVNYENNKNKVLREINKNIPLKLEDNLGKTKKSCFVPNDKMAIVEREEGFMPLEFHYDIENLTSRDKIIRNMVEVILHGKYFITNEEHAPLSIENNSGQKANTEYYNVHVDIPFDDKIDVNKELKEFNTFLQKVCDSDLESEVQKRKSLEKENIKYHLTEDTSAYTRYNKQLTSDIFNAYEQIESITQDDVKNYIRKYMIDQTPNVCLYSKEMSED